MSAESKRIQKKIDKIRARLIGGDQVRKQRV